MISLSTETSRLEPNAVALYVEYLGVAPANLDAPWGRRVLSGLGMFLVQRAAELALAGYGGRLGLHALPTVESYYPLLRSTRVGPEATIDGTWLYFELEPLNALRLVQNGPVTHGG